MLLAAPAVVSAIPAQAQSVQAQSTGVPVVSREVVQPLPAAGTGTLNSALQRLAANPRDTGALVDAGFAALEIGDVDAAVGFFSRADAISPGIPRAQAGLGAAYVRSENPYDALLRFEEAEKGALDRGLKVRTLNLPDIFQDQDSPVAMYAKAGLNAEHIAAASLTALGVDATRAARA